MRAQNKKSSTRSRGKDKRGKIFLIRQPKGSPKVTTLYLGIHMMVQGQQDPCGHDSVVNMHSCPYSAIYDTRN